MEITSDLMKEICAKCDNIPQAFILLAIIAIGRPTVSDLMEFTGLARQNIHTHVHALMKNDLVFRIPVAHGGRTAWEYVYNEKSSER